MEIQRRDYVRETELNSRSGDGVRKKKTVLVKET